MDFGNKSKTSAVQFQLRQLFEVKGFFCYKHDTRHDTSRYAMISLGYVVINPRYVQWISGTRARSAKVQFQLRQIVRSQRNFLLRYVIYHDAYCYVMISLGYDHKHWMNTQCPSGPRSRLCELAIGPDGSVVPHNGGDLGQRAHRAGRHRGGTPSFERTPWTVDDFPGVLLLSRMRGRWVMASFLRDGVRRVIAKGWRNTDRACSGRR